MHPKTKTILYYVSYLVVGVLAFFTAWMNYGLSGWVSLAIALVAMLAYFALVATCFNWQARRERAYEARFTRRTA